MLKRQWTWIGLAALLSAFFLFLFWPAWQAYLLVDNRELLKFDPASHVMDGVKLYQQLTTLDIPSFLLQLLSFGFWLPFHPILVALMQVFFPGQLDPLVFMNHLIFAATNGVILVWLLQSTQLKTAQRIPLLATLLAASTAFNLRVAHSSDFLGLINIVMLEPLAYALISLFLFSSTLHFLTKSSVFFKTTVWLLLITFLTKVHYGIFILPVWIIALGVLTDSLQPKALIRDARALLKDLSRRRYAQVLAALLALDLIFIACKFLLKFEQIHILSVRISTRGYLNALWFALWIPLLVWTIETLKKRNTILRGASTELRYFHWVFALPYAWFYLFPFRHKLGAFFYNVNYGTHSDPWTLAQNLSYYPKTLIERYIVLTDLGAPEITLTVAIALLALALFPWKVPAKRKALGYLFAQAGFFYLLMSLFNSNKDVRMASTWVANWLGIWLYAVYESTTRLITHYRSRASKIIHTLIACSALLLLSVHLRGSIDPEKLAQIERGNFLEKNVLDTDFIIQTFDSSRPGIIWGMGLDQAAPWVDLKIRSRNKRSTSLILPKQLYVNDFGLDGNRDPVGFIRRFHQKHHAEQYVLFRAGFDPNALSTLVRELTSDGKLAVMRESPYYVYLGAAK